MAYNSKMRSKVYLGLVRSGADLLKHMYDIRIFFPSFDGPIGRNAKANQDKTEAFASRYPITVRANGFNIPDIETGTYDIEYHGNKMKRPNGQVSLDRQVDVEFREDAVFDLRKYFTSWHMATTDPVTGATGNVAAFCGQIEVSTIAGAYFATSLAAPAGDGRTADNNGLWGGEVFGANGQLTNGRDHGTKIIDPDKLGKLDDLANPNELAMQEQEFYSDNYTNGTPTGIDDFMSKELENPLATWTFYDVWVSKVAGIQFTTAGGDANTYGVTFQYGDFDMPIYGGNDFDTQAVGK